MENLKRKWRRVPGTVRRPVIFILGSLFIIAAALTGWLPGPGGIPLFLIGIAILATEFEYAERFQKWVLGIIHDFGRWYRAHRLLGTVLLIGAAAGAAVVGYMAYKKL